MPSTRHGALIVSRRFCSVLIALNQLMGVVIVVLLIASFAARGFVVEALKVNSLGGNGLLGMRLIMLLGIAGVFPAQMVLTRLIAIVDTVASGDPFVASNARRLQAIAWAVTSLEVLHMLVGLVGVLLVSPERVLDRWEPSITRWLVILLCFVLARVFEQGTRMRDDLAGTV